MNVIAKKFNLTIDTIDTKPIRIKDSFVLGDSIELSINLTESKAPKDITETNMRLLMSCSDGVYEQVKDIIIVDAVKGLIKIKLEPHMVSKLNMCLFQLIIEDLDENIACQKFIINVIDSLSSQVILESQDGLSTLRKLNQEIDNYTVALRDIKQHVEDVSKEIDGEFIAIDNKFVDINKKATDLENKLNGIGQNVDILPKLIKLKTYNVNGSSFYYFATDVLSMSAMELTNCAFNLFLKGKALNDTTIQTCTAQITFQQSNVNNVPTIRPIVAIISDISVQAKTLSPSVVFQNLSSEISASATGFRLLIKSNIAKSLNYESELYCSITSLGENLR